MNRNVCTIEVNATLGNTEAAIRSCLHTRDGWRLAQLYVKADEDRRRTVGNAVGLMARIDLDLASAEEIYACADDALRLGYTTLLLTGTDAIGRGWLADVLAGLRRWTGLRVVLKLGRRAADDLRAWHEAGAEGYLAEEPADVPALREMGYNVGLVIAADDVHAAARRLAEMPEDLAMVRIAGADTADELLHRVVALARLTLGDAEVIAAAEQTEPAVLALRRGASTLETDMLALHRAGAIRAGATLRRRIALIGRAVAA